MIARRNKAGQFHCEDGPALEFDDGTKTWAINGQLHRLDGPAIERSDGSTEYWIANRRLTDDEFALYKFVNKLV